VAADLDARGRDARIRLAAPIDETTLRTMLADHLWEVETLGWDTTTQAVVDRAQTRLDALVLESRPIPIPDPEAALALLLGEIERHLDQTLPWDREARQLQARVALLRRIEPAGGWPDLSDRALAASLREWLAPWLQGKWSLAALDGLRLSEVLGHRLDWGQRARLEVMAPRQLPTPAGSQRRLDYLAGELPVLAVPIQELFGTEETPSICGGRLPVMLHLLSPAGRPAQITQDLAGFWTRGYPEVRKELRGRYPRHHWPENPLAAAPTRHAKRRPKG